MGVLRYVGAEALCVASSNQSSTSVERRIDGLKVSTAHLFSGV